MGTLLMRSAGTVRNELLNIDHYALGAGIEQFRGRGQGHLGIVVSAGPSLRRNIDQLAAEGVRERSVIVAAQTTRALLWGHRDFATTPRRDGQWVLHGHTITDMPQMQAGRQAPLR